MPEPVSLGMDTTTPDLGPQAARVARLVAGVRDEQLGNPTPCDGTTVAGMLDHLVGLTTAFTMAGVEPIVAASPMPLAPIGLNGVGVTV